jgi:hypothetical protein
MLSENLARKFWGHVEKKLLNIKNITAYYCGGTLFVSIGNEKEIALNLDGSGFLLNHYPHLKNATIYQPNFILKKVRKIYLKEKGKTEHYKDSLDKRRM